MDKANLFGLTAGSSKELGVTAKKYKGKLLNAVRKIYLIEYLIRLRKLKVSYL